MSKTLLERLETVGPLCAEAAKHVRTLESYLARTGADFFIETKPTDEELAEAIRCAAAHGEKLIAELNRRKGYTTHSAGSLDKNCICYGNWRKIVADTEHLLDKEFVRDYDGKIYSFTGVMHGSDDFYYVMWSKERTIFSSCVGSLETNGFTPLVVGG